MALQDPGASYEPNALDGHIHLKRSTGGSYSPAAALRPGECSEHLRPMLALSARQATNADISISAEVYYLAMPSTAPFQEVKKPVDR